MNKQQLFSSDMYAQGASGFLDINKITAAAWLNEILIPFFAEHFSNALQLEKKTGIYHCRFHPLYKIPVHSWPRRAPLSARVMRLCRTNNCSQQHPSTRNRTRDKLQEREVQD